jgi:hypothetical protein
MSDVRETTAIAPAGGISLSSKEYKHFWYMRHREELIKRATQYQKDHPEAAKIYAITSRAKNKAQYLKWQKKYRMRNRDKERTRVREYYYRKKSEAELVQ